jgi:hypothetical protein
VLLGDVTERESVEVASGIVGSDSSAAVTVKEPTAFIVTASSACPPKSCVFAGRVALSSVEESDTTCVIDVTMLYEASQASTRTVKGSPTV